MYKENLNPRKQIEFALENRIPLVVIIGEDEITTGIVKIKVFFISNFLDLG
jgi:histidyl-tRNA synthetase